LVEGQVGGARPASQKTAMPDSRTRITVQKLELQSIANSAHCIVSQEKVVIFVRRSLSDNHKHPIHQNPVSEESLFPSSYCLPTSDTAQAETQIPLPRVHHGQQAQGKRPSRIARRR
jgi:hypothetical protein